MTTLFLDYLLHERRRSQKTVDSYREDLGLFQKWFEALDSQINWNTVDADLIRGWMESMMDNGLAASSICRRLSALKSFYRFLLMRGRVDHDPAQSVTAPKKAKRLPSFVREAEMDRLIDVLPWNDDFNGLRARTIILLLYETGIRSAELLTLDIKDVDFTEGVMKVTGKRNKQRVIPFGQELADSINSYIQARNGLKPQTEALFINNKGERMTYPQLRTLVIEQLSKVTSQKKKSPHVLRHSFATAMLNNRADLEGVRQLLGHESLATTEVYTHTSFEQLRKVYQTAHPRKNALQSSTENNQIPPQGSSRND